MDDLCWLNDVALHRIRTVVLGNAYLSLFFITNQDAKVLKQCSSAYSQAVSLQSWLKLPSLALMAMFIKCLCLLHCTGFSRLEVPGQTLDGIPLDLRLVVKIGVLILHVLLPLTFRRKIQCRPTVLTSITTRPRYIASCRWCAVLNSLTFTYSQGDSVWLYV